MDPVNVVALTRQLVDIDSTTGRESEVAAVLAGYLRGRGYSVLEQPLEGGRCNVIASVAEPEIVFSTHFDCVPPFLPSREEQGAIYGRGSTDAKGILAAQVAAAERLRATGETRVGLVFVAGEERGSDGAQAANRLASRSRFLINGEPTDNRLALATRGVYRVRLEANGRAAHSGYPELGESAIDKLIDALNRMRAVPWPSDGALGTTHYTVGLINGGVAPNIVPPSAAAEVIFRSVGDHAVLRGALHEAVGDLVSVHEVLEVPCVHLRTLDGFETAVFSYATDIPFLTNWGTPLLLGPGSIHVAHTDHEHIRIAELEEAIGLYETVARTLLGE